MVDARNLADAIWPAINIEMMHSQAWSVCFNDKFRQEDYRRIVHVVFFWAASSNPCTVGELCEQVSDAHGIDDKTVKVRINEMVSGGLLELSQHEKDKRKKIVAPTKSLVAAYTRFSDLLVDFQIEFRNQMDKGNRTRRTHEPTPALYFDLLDHVDNSSAPRGRSSPLDAAPTIKMKTDLLRGRK